MHRSGSSLTTSILHSLGVHIGDELLGTHPSQPYGHWENVHFYRLNMEILKAAGGNWVNPPSVGAIQAVKPQFKGRILKTIQGAKKKLWGWKDPRTCLTIPLYLPHLEDPRFVLVYRETAAIVESLMRRSGSKGDGERWRKLAKTYQDSMERWSADYAHQRIDYERLVNPSWARDEVTKLCLFVGGNGEIERALKNIHYV
jgi:hypothetical protein